MKKIILLGVIALSTAVFSNEKIIMDKEVIGVNKEQLETFSKERNIEIKEEVIILNDKNISTDKIRAEKHNLELEESNDSISKSMVKEESSSVWKYILGAITLVAIGVAL